MTGQHGTPLKVGPSTYSRGGNVEIARYRNGDIALQVVGDDGETEYTATVCLAQPAGPGRVWIKNWSENEGVSQAFEKAGLIRLTGETYPAGFTQAELAEVLPPLKAVIERTP